MSYLFQIELQDCGDRTGMAENNNDNRVETMALVWVNQNLRYFILTALSLEEVMVLHVHTFIK